MNERNIRLDFIRSVAIFLVFCSHFLDFGGVYAQGGMAFLVAGLRMLFTACVALFMILTGYLQCDKKLSTGFYFRGILKIYGIYFLCSLLTFAIKAFVLHEQLGLRYMLSSFFNFYSCTYAWYLMLYLGLLGIMPFLNIIFNNLSSKRQHLFLIAVFVYFTILPSLSNTFVQLQSVWFKNLFPVCYYFTGAYLRRYKPEVSAWKVLVAMLSALVVFICADRFIYGKDTAWITAVCYYDHYQMYIFSILFFVMLLNFPAEKAPVWFKRFSAQISALSLAMYLMSGIVDDIVYRVFWEKVPEVSRSLVHMLPCVLIVFVSSVVLGQLVMWVHPKFDKLIKNLIYRFIPALKAE